MWSFIVLCYVSEVDRTVGLKMFTTIRFSADLRWNREDFSNIQNLRNDAIPKICIQLNNSYSFFRSDHAIQKRGFIAYWKAVGEVGELRLMW